MLRVELAAKIFSATAANETGGCEFDEFDEFSAPVPQQQQAQS
jgi:hypothetical protein